MQARLLHLFSLAAAVAAVGITPSPACAQTANDVPGLLAPLRRAEEVVTFAAKDGKSQAQRVAIDQWTLVAGREITRFPAEGDVLVQLRAGLITTLIDGQRQDRKEGDFWLLPAGTQMSVSVKTEMATLQTVSLKR